MHLFMRRLNIQIINPLILRRAIVAAIVAAIVSVGCFTPIRAGAYTPPYAAMVVDVDTGRILYSRNATKKRLPASLTKMMTLYLAFENLANKRIKFSTLAPVSKRASRKPPSKIGLKAGRKISIGELLEALVVKSGNDAATALAEFLGRGNEKRFVAMMNQKARQLGMRRTKFGNPSGLPHRGQYTTARDMAILARKLYLNFPQYWWLFSTRKFTYNGVTHNNTNKLLRYFAGTNGIKTGYTARSGYNLAASVQRKGRHLIGIVLGGKTSQWRNDHMVFLMNKNFARISARKWPSRPDIHKAPWPVAKPVLLGKDILPPQKPQITSQTSQQQKNPSRGNKKLTSLAISPEPKPIWRDKPEIGVKISGVLPPLMPRFLQKDKGPADKQLLDRP